jgi:predicted RNase H-like HicB family nuclease/predicted RNA binding protein YcfA (HicA-like mRNA interferase family)
VEKGLKVREPVRLLEDDGWRQVRMKGSHRQCKHPVKLRGVTVPGKEWRRPGFRYAEEHPETGASEGMEILILAERSETGFSAYWPDLPGCVSTDATGDECTENMHAAIEFHLEGMEEGGLPLPNPTSSSTYDEVAG